MQHCHTEVIVHKFKCNHVRLYKNLLGYWVTKTRSVQEEWQNQDFIAYAKKQ